MNGNELQDRIFQLRGQGKSWTEIGEELGMRTERVRSLYRRHRNQHELGPEARPADCLHSNEYSGQRLPPRCCGGTGCEKCWAKYRAFHPGDPPMEQLEEPARVHEPPLFPDWEVPQRPHWTEWLDLFQHVNRLFIKSNAYVSKLTIELPDAPAVIASASDLHMGSGFVNHRELKRTLEFLIETPGLYVGVAGDSIEGFIPGVHGAETTEQMAGSLGAQLFALESLVNDLTAAGKLLYWTWGEHDAKWFEDRVGVNVIKLLVDRKVPYFPGRGLLRVKVGPQEYFFHINHGERYKSMLSATHPQRRMYDYIFPADVTIAGHLHKPAYHVEHLYEYARDLGLPFGGKTVFIQNGTFKTGPDVYTIRSWERGIIGVPTLILSNTTHDMDIMDSPWKAMAFLRGMEARK